MIRLAAIVCVLMIPESDIQPGRELLDHRDVGEEVEAEPAVLLRDRDPEQPHRLHLLDEVRRVLVVVLEVARDREHLALDPPPHRGAQLVPDLRIRRSSVDGRRRSRHLAVPPDGQRGEHGDDAPRSRPAPRAPGARSAPPSTQRADRVDHDRHRLVARERPGASPAWWPPARTPPTRTRSTATIGKNAACAVSAFGAISPISADDPRQRVREQQHEQRAPAISPRDVVW